MSESVAIEVMGRQFKIKSDDGAEHVRQVAQVVDEKINEANPGPGHPTQQTLLMASLNLADELVKLRAKHAALADRLRASSKALLSQLGA